MTVHVKRPERLHRKVATIQSAGRESLHVISDFDRTLSRSVIEGKKVPSLFGLIRS
ncbi:hypothetical protein JXA12_05630 [Candidatus Woesearchaeota archaeon]|nr:hypothetical protein [Candidatus Woesearchaeota archaeon]